MTNRMASLLLALGVVFPSARVVLCRASRLGASSIAGAAGHPAHAVAGSTQGSPGSPAGGTRPARCATVRSTAGGPVRHPGFDRSIVAPQRVPGLDSVDSVSVLSGSACARSGGRVMCWGDNRWGELGDGTTTGARCAGRREEAHGRHRANRRRPASHLHDRRRRTHAAGVTARTDSWATGRSVRR